MVRLSMCALFPQATACHRQTLMDVLVVCSRHRIQTSLVRTDPKYQQTKFEIDFLPPKVVSALHRLSRCPAVATACGAALIRALCMQGVAETGVVMFCHGFEQVTPFYSEMCLLQSLLQT
jgi:hypothetical protein